MPGTFVYREVWRGHLMSALPMTLVRHTGRRLVLYHPADTPWRAARLRGDSREWSRELFLETLAAPTAWELLPLSRGGKHSLFLYETGTAYTVRLAWDRNWSFLEWYVNFETPWHRTPIGADSMDHFLDIVVAADLSWTIKDGDELAEAVRRGLLARAQAARTRRLAQDLIGRIERGAPPFCEPWPEWRPDPDWPRPVLPADWASGV